MTLSSICCCGRNREVHYHEVGLMDRNIDVVSMGSEEALEARVDATKLVIKPPQGRAFRGLNQVWYRVFVDNNLWKEGIFTRDFRVRRNQLCWGGLLTLSGAAVLSGSVATHDYGMQVAGWVVFGLGLVVLGSAFPAVNDHWNHREIPRHGAFVGVPHHLDPV